MGSVVSSCAEHAQSRANFPNETYSEMRPPARDTPQKPHTTRTAGPPAHVTIPPVEPKNIHAPQIAFGDERRNSNGSWKQNTNTKTKGGGVKTGHSVNGGGMYQTPRPLHCMVPPLANHAEKNHTSETNGGGANPTGALAFGLRTSMKTHGVEIIGLETKLGKVVVGNDITPRPDTKLPLGPRNQS